MDLAPVCSRRMSYVMASSRIEILAGLQAGDKVVVGRHTGLSDGEKVDAEQAGYEANPSHP